MSELHFKLPSGRVLLLNEPLSDEELEALKTPEGIKAMEALADLISLRSIKQITEDQEAFSVMLKMHGIRP